MKQIVDISKLRKYEVTYIPVYDISMPMRLDRRVVIAESESDATKQILSRKPKAGILNVHVIPVHND